MSRSSFTTVGEGVMEEEVRGFIEAQKISSIYPGELAEIERSLIERWTSKSDELQEVEEENLAEILKNREEAVLKYNEAVKREIEVRSRDLGQINDQLIELESSQEYRDQLFNERILAKNEIIKQDKIFLNLAIEGRKTYDSEIAAAQQQISPNSKLRKSAQIAASALLSPVKYFGRGTIYDSKVNDDERYHQYLETRSVLLKQLRSKLGVKNPKIKELVDNFESICDDKNFAFGEAELMALQKQIIDEIAKIEKLNEAELKAVHSKIDELNKETKDGLQKYLEDEDATWPYVALQIALLATPLAGLSFLPMIGGIIEPMFDENLSFGKAVGAVIGNIPGFGPLFHLMKIDYAIGWLLDNCPVIDGVTKILHECTANIFTGAAFDLVAPVLATELVGFVVPGAYYGYVLDPKINNRDGEGNFISNKYDIHNQFVKDQEALMKETLEEFKKNGIEIDKKNSKELQEALLKNSIDTLYSAANEAQFEAVTKTINSAPGDHLEELFSDIKIEENTFCDLLKSNKESALLLLKEHPKLVNEAAEKIIAYELDIDSFKANKDNIPTILSDHRREMLDKMGASLSQKADLANFIYSGSEKSLGEIFKGIEINFEMPDGTFATKSVVDLKKDPELSKPSQILNFISGIDAITTKSLVKEMNKNLTPATSPKARSGEFSVAKESKVSIR